ncbi:MAG TPA: class I SAM-dependent methyltransferase [Vicinamibacterales bacterium]|nr:class I SAM-dependent methyltransferase [Vicinamibacterales bacterium]
MVVGTRDRDGRPLRTVLCRVCGLVWTNPRPPAAAMKAYYESAYRADYKGHGSPPLRKIVRGFLGAAERRTLLRRLLRSTSSAGAGAQPRMLDVGCGAGELVYLMRRDGVEASGIEPGIEFSGFARDVLRVPIQTADVEAAVVEAASQDLVTMFHALEHVPDPRGLLSVIRGWMLRGGRLVVEVPNIASRVQAPSHQYHYAHLHHFTGSTLAAIGEAAGLRCIDTTYSPDGGNVLCVFRREGDEQKPPGGLESDAARTLALLGSHTAIRHYCSTVPFARAVGRLRRRLAENRLLRQIRDVDGALRWADAL